VSNASTYSLTKSEYGRAVAALTTALASRGIDTTVLGKLDEAAVGTLGASDRRLASGGLVSEPGVTLTERLMHEPLAFTMLLGEGGMGEVHLASQPSLRRDVAVKVASSRVEDAEPALFKEALVGAHVEHPNVVPVHALARVSAPHGEATGLLMKRIEGRAWSRILAQPEIEAALVKERGAEDALTFHVSILVRVCHAMAFAHSRGVVHLDLKPDNVMVGDHGEVYVLDWGLAAGFGKEAPHWLAQTSEIRRVAGTPGYMAPELAAADASVIGACTDVYLLGAVLHHVLTGEPLHRGDSLMELLGSAFASVPPTYGPEVPRELGDIVVRATRFEPKERFPSVLALREALEAFLRHRPADRLLSRVEEGLARLETLASEKRAEGDDERRDEEIEPLLAECDIALEEARRSFAEHPRLPALDRGVALRRIEHALVSERPADARQLLPRLSPDPDLSARTAERITALEARLSERARHLHALEDLERDLDLTLGAASRTRLWLLFGVAWALVSLGYLAIERLWHVPLTYPALLVQGGVMVGVLLPVAILFRRTLLENRAHQRLYGGLALTGLTVELLWIMGLLMDIPIHTALAMTTLLYTYAFATIAIAIDRRVLPATFVMAGAAALTALMPELVHAWLGLGGLSAVLVTTRAWRLENRSSSPATSRTP
jgi:serine/threonine protein kinase